MKTKRIVIVIANLLAVGFWACYFFWPTEARRLAREFPPAPFTPFPPDYPRIIANREEPAADKQEEYAEYTRERAVASEFTWQRGVLSRVSEDEREAYRQAVQGTEYNSARKLVEKILTDNPESVAGRFVLATITQESDANFPLALSILQKLRRELHQAGVQNANDESAREWYLRILNRERSLLEDLRKFEDCLAALDIIDRLYEPMPAGRIWPLMRMGRFAESEKYVEEVEASKRFPTWNANSRFALANELGDRESYVPGKQLYDLAGTTNSVYASNFYASCIESFRFDEAHRTILAATKMPIGYRGSPFTGLAGYLSASGHLPDAWQALKDAQVQRRKRAPYTLVFDQVNFDKQVSETLFLAGYSEHAYRLAEKSFSTPSRSTNSNSTIDVEYSKRIQYYIMLKNECHAIAERIAVAANSSMAGRSELAEKSLELWTIQQELTILVLNEDYFQSVIRPYVPGSPSVSGHFLPDVATLAPNGIARESLRQAREKERAVEAVPYFDAVEAELEWLSGNYEASIALCHKCLAEMNDFEVMLRGRVNLIEADSLRQLNRMPEAIDMYSQALKNGGAFVRLLDIPIPISIAEDGHPFSTEWAHRLINSPRFVASDQGFLLVLRADDSGISFNLQRPDGTVHCMGRVESAPKWELMERATITLMQKIVSPNFQLSAADINSLENAIFAAPEKERTDALLQVTNQ